MAFIQIVYRIEFSWEVPTKFVYAYMNSKYGMRAEYRIASFSIGEKQLISTIRDEFHNLSYTVQSSNPLWYNGPEYGNGWTITLLETIQEALNRGGKLWYRESEKFTSKVKINPGDDKEATIKTYKKKTGEKDDFNPNGFGWLFDEGHKAHPDAKRETVHLEYKSDWIITQDFILPPDGVLKTKFLDKVSVMPWKENRALQVQMFGFS